MLFQYSMSTCMIIKLWYFLMVWISFNAAY